MAAAEFAIFSTNNSQKVYSPGQLIFVRDMILPIKHTVCWELIRQRKQTHVNKYDIHKNKLKFDYDYKVGDNVILTNQSAYKYKLPYKVTLVITQCFTNGTVNLQCGPIISMYTISRINP